MRLIAVIIFLGFLAACALSEASRKPKKPKPPQIEHVEVDCDRLTTLEVKDSDWKVLQILKEEGLI